MTPMRKFVRHVELYGSEGVYEAAEAEGWPYEQLGNLALHLRRVDPRWRLGTEARSRMVEQLLVIGLPVGKIARLAGAGRTTVWKARSDAARMFTSSDRGISGRPLAGDRRSA